MATKVLTGGDALQKKLAEIAQKMGGGAVEVGFMAGATYPDGTPVASVAFWNEFGTSRAPARPFFRGMIEKESPTWAGKMAKLAEVTNYNGEQVLGMMGADIQGALKQSIYALTTPPLAKATILARAAGSKHGAIKSPTIAKPLVDTGQMVNSITYKVEQ